MNQLTMKLRRSVLCILLAAAATFLYGCGTTDENSVSENAQTVILATMNTPNSDLFDEALITVLGGSNSLTDAEKAEKEAVRTKIESNWQAAVGHCFSPGSFERFQNSTIATQFYLDSFITKGYTEVLSMTLVSQDDRVETVDVEVDVNGESTDLYTVVFRKNTDGLFYSVELLEGGNN